MKKLPLIVLCILVTGTLQAQKKKASPKVKPLKVEEMGKVVVGIHAGLSLTGLLYEASERDIDSIKYKTSVKPAYQITCDYFVSNKISIGFFSSIQPFRVDISHWEFDTINPKHIDDLQAKIKRIYVGGKFLYHFKNTTKVDIYSGIRVGALFWNNKLPSTDPQFINTFNDEFPMFNRPSIGIIPIGFRVKFTPQIAANFEINASSPHLFSFGGAYTLD